MTNKEAVNWIINLSADIGKSEHRELWHYEQALYEIREILESEPQWIPVSSGLLPKESDGKVLITVSGEVETGKYSEFSKTWFIGVLNGVGGDAPIAWMPLPESYRGEYYNEGI